MQVFVHKPCAQIFILAYFPLTYSISSSIYSSCDQILFQSYHYFPMAYVHNRQIVRDEESISLIQYCMYVKRACEFDFWS